MHMDDKLSRRELGRKAAVGAVALTLSSLAGAQEKPVPEPPNVDADLAAIEKGLAKPLSDEARKLARAALTSRKKTELARRAFHLPENSEPLWVVVPQPKEVR